MTAACEVAHSAEAVARLPPAILVPVAVGTIGGLAIAIKAEAPLLKLLGLALSGASVLAGVAAGRFGEQTSPCQ